MKISTLYPSQCTLGESPVWHQRRGSYFWVDIEEGILHELNTATRNVKVWNLHRRVSVIIEQTDGTLVLGVQGGLIKFDPTDGRTSPLVDIDAGQSQNRCNDGACDSEGRIWIGTMEVHCEPGAGSLYCVNNSLGVKKMMPNLTIPNGIVWSADMARMYFIETMSRTVKSYIYNRLSADIHFEKVAINIPESMGYPDGMKIDTEGKLWIALYGGQAVSRWDPETGILLQKIELPALNITNCCFAGENLDELVVTSARENLTAEQLKQFPESGNVFRITGIGVKGSINNRSNHIK